MPYAKLILLTVWVFLVTIWTTVSAEELVFANDSTPYCPYTLCDAGKDGFVIDIVNAIYKPHGYTVTITNVPWNRALAMVNAGRVNAVLGVTKNAAPNLIYPHTEISRYSPSVFSLVSNGWRFDSVDSLKKIRLGLVENYGNGEGNPELEKYLGSKPANVSYIATDDAVQHLFMMVQANRIDALIEDQAVGNYILQRTGMTQLFRNTRIQANSILGFVGFRADDQKSRELADLFDQGMVSLRKTGQLKTILAAYGLTDWQK